MNLNILIIEDETIVALHIKKVISTLGYNSLKIVKNAKDAFSTAAENRVDLVISDINIQGDMDGIECSSILQEKYNVPIIFVTAYHDIETLKKASAVDFAGYVVKPFREDELETIINLAILKYDLSTQNHTYKICDNYSYSHLTNELFFQNKAITLTKKETMFIATLVFAKGTVVSHAILDEKIWEGAVVEDGTRRQLVHRFKQKAPTLSFSILRGVGYKLNS